MLQHLSPRNLKFIFIFCAICCFVALLPLPIGYYTFLRICVTIGALLAVALIYQNNNMAITAAFVIIAFLFNPIVPIYLQKKAIWMPLDILTGAAFLMLAFLHKVKNIPEQNVATPNEGKVDKSFVRDRIIENKNPN